MVKEFNVEQSFFSQKTSKNEAQESMRILEEKSSMRYRSLKKGKEEYQGTPKDRDQLNNFMERWEFTSFYGFREPK